MNTAIEQTEQSIGYEFADKALLACALTHKSYTNEHKNCESNERLEYLGDSVLGMIVAEYLYARFPDADEGVLTSTRQTIVSREPLAAAVQNLQLFRHYRLGKGAAHEVPAFAPKTVSNVFEAVLGAIYLDGGYAAAREFVLRHLIRDINLPDAESKAATRTDTAH